MGMKPVVLSILLLGSMSALNITTYGRSKASKSGVASATTRQVRAKRNTVRKRVNRLGTYVLASKKDKDVIVLASGGKLTAYHSPPNQDYKMIKGRYSIRGNTVRFVYSYKDESGGTHTRDIDEGTFVGDALYTYFNSYAGDFGGDYDPSWPLGYKHKKIR